MQNLRALLRLRRYLSQCARAQAGADAAPPAPSSLVTATPAPPAEAAEHRSGLPFAA